jgi:hypothetical protein
MTQVLPKDQVGNQVLKVGCVLCIIALGLYHKNKTHQKINLR